MTTSAGSPTSLSDSVEEGDLASSTSSPSGSMVARSGMVLTSAVALAGAGNYATNALLARRLTSEAFGDAALIVTLMLGVTAIAGCVQLSVASRTAQLAASPSIGRLKDDTRWTWLLGFALAGGVMLLAPTLTDLLNVANSVPFIVFAVGIPFQLDLAVRRGRLQGQLRFAALGRSFIVEMAARLIATWVFLELWTGAEAAAAGVTIAFVTAGLAAASERHGADVAGDRALIDRVSATSSVTSAATLLGGHMLLANADLLLVKAAFSSESAGTYAVVALVGRGLLFCGSAVANTVFPLSARDPDSPATRRIVARAMGVLGVGGAALTAGAWLVGGAAIDVLFDGGYPGVDRLIGPFMLGTSALVLMHFLASVDVAAGRSTRARIMLLAGVFQSIMIMSLGTELEDVVWARTVGLIIALLIVVTVGCTSSREMRP